VTLAAAFALQGTGATGRWADVVVAGTPRRGVGHRVWAADVARPLLWLSAALALSRPC